MKKSLAVLAMSVAALGAATLVAQSRDEARQAVIARGKSLELPTKYVPASVMQGTLSGL